MDGCVSSGIPGNIKSEDRTPMGLLTHLQSHSFDVMEAGVDKSESAICEYKKVFKHD